MFTQHLSQFEGRPVVRHQGGALEDPGAVAHRVLADPRCNWNGEEGLLQGLLEAPNLGDLEALVLGAWPMGYDDPSGTVETRDLLIGAADRLRSLRALFWGDITFEEAELSWIENTDLTPLLQAYPELEALYVRGGKGLRFEDLEHENLRKLVVQTGGMSMECIWDICHARLPALEHLELWLGQQWYGFDGSIEDLEPLILGRSYPELDYPFPKLKYLGLQNAVIADEIAESLANAIFFDQIETLSLAMGTTSARGARALLDNPHIHKLQCLDLSQCCIDDEDLLAQLQALPLELVADGQRDGDCGGEDGYTAVGE